MVVWEDKKYYAAALAAKLDKEGKLPELLKMLE